MILLQLASKICLVELFGNQLAYVALSERERGGRLPKVLPLAVGAIHELPLRTKKQKISIFHLKIFLRKMFLVVLLRFLLKANCL